MPRFEEALLGSSASSISLSGRPTASLLAHTKQWNQVAYPIEATIFNDLRIALPGRHLGKRGHEFSSFFGDPSTLNFGHMKALNSGEEFLFNVPLPKMTGTGHSSSSLPALLQPAKYFTPKVKMSMLAGAGTVAGALLTVTRKQAALLDPFGSGHEEQREETGWCRVIPRCLRFALASDLWGLFILASSLHLPCDVPLRTWIVGGMLLGFPVDALVQRVAKNRPSFSTYRLTITELRAGSGSNPNDFKLDSIVLYNQFGVAIHGSRLRKRLEDNMLFVDITDSEEMVVGYQLVTHRTSNPATDPSSWVLEGSKDGRSWQLMDECSGEELPRARETATVLYEDLLHVGDSVSAFRSAFLCEVFATAVSFGWLVAGTSWVSMGTESCVDSAPFLWYSSYFTVVTVWSFLGTITILLIISAVAMVALGSKPPTP
jgi:hypothetical protein